MRGEILLMLWSLAGCGQPCNIEAAGMCVMTNGLELDARAAGATVAAVEAEVAARYGSDVDLAGELRGRGVVLELVTDAREFCATDHAAACITTSLTHIYVEPVPGDCWESQRRFAHELGHFVAAVSLGTLEPANANHAVPWMFIKWARAARQDVWGTVEARAATAALRVGCGQPPAGERE